MIPKKIHYCWFGKGEMPKHTKECIDSWHRFMPNYEYKLWNESNFDVSSVQYTKEAYEMGFFAFVSDFVRLHALANEGGIYLDVDFEVYKPFDSLLIYHAFAGFEGSKTNPIMMGVIASEADGAWATEQLEYYQYRSFMRNGKPDLTTNVKFVTDRMKEHGFIPNGKEQDYKDLHVFPVEYFSPKQTTGEYFFTVNTFCEHRGHNSSWAPKSIKDYMLKFIPSNLLTSIIKFKRNLWG